MYKMPTARFSTAPTTSRSTGSILDSSSSTMATSIQRQIIKYPMIATKVVFIAIKSAKINILSSDMRAVLTQHSIYKRSEISKSIQKSCLKSESYVPCRRRMSLTLISLHYSDFRTGQRQRRASHIDTYHFYQLEDEVDVFYQRSDVLRHSGSQKF